MTVPATTRKAGPFLGNGVQTSFPFAFKVFSEGDVAVTLTDALGLDSLAVLNTDYSVTINPNQGSSPGGAITYPLSGAPLAVGARLTVTGDIDYDQPLDLPSGGNFSPLALENQLDRTTFQIQQLREILSRSVLAPVSSTASGQLPRPEASSIIGWDANETALQNYPLASLATGIAYSAQYVEQFAGNGVTTNFTLNNDPVVTANTLVVVDGLIVTPGVDYILAASAIVFTVAPAPSAEILVRYGQAVQTGGGSVDSLDVSHTPAVGAPTNARAALRAIEADNWVTTPRLTNDSVTFAKLQNIPNSTILGRSTAGTGDVEVLTGAQATALLVAASDTVSGRVELADAAEAQALSDNTRAITPARLASALQGSNQLMNSTGYQRLPGGVIIQWGNFSAVVGANTVTYPIAFPVSTFVVVATAGGNNAGNNTTSYVDGIGLTNFNLVNATGTTNNWKWIAIGR